MFRVASYTCFIVLFTINDCVGFSVGKFRSEMNIEEAMNLLGEGYKLSHIEKIDHYHKVHFEEKLNSELVTWKLTFCENSLVKIFRARAINWEYAAKHVRSMNKLYGKGYVRDEFHEVEGMPSIGVGRMSNIGIKLMWENDAEYVEFIFGEIKIPEKIEKHDKNHWKKELILEVYSLKSDLC